MKRYSLILFMAVLVVFGFLGCEKKNRGGVAQMHWDRDMCERCQMAISERKFAVQIINPKNHKVYKFDDLGCAVLWLDEEKIPWKEKAILWITDAKTGQWMNARQANYVDGARTPMAYGFAAYSKSTLPKNSQSIDYSQVVQAIEKKEKSHRVNRKMNQ
ncbi:MAG: hypothetical protein FAF03_09610 [Epsilonproteobacteria bacterium]|nr:hypothetical protein [Campylobacterota bacterium]